MECIECEFGFACKDRELQVKHCYEVEHYCSKFKYFLDDLNRGELKVAEYKSKSESKAEIKKKGKGLFE